MPKLPLLSGADVCRILKKHGFVQVRQKGSHIIMQLKTGVTTTTVAHGNNRAPIVKHDSDRDWFVETLGEAIQRAQCQLHAFVLMRNHCHLLLETPKANLVDGMRWLQGTCTARFNASHLESGHPANLPRLVRQARNATKKSPLGKLVSMLQCES